MGAADDAGVDEDVTAVTGVSRACVAGEGRVRIVEGSLGVLM